MGKQLCYTPRHFICLALLQIFFLSLTSCIHGQNNAIDPIISRAHGAYIVCEGNFQRTSGTIYYLDTSKAFHAVGDCYKTANGFDAGNVLQSATILNNHLYLIANNSNKIEQLNTNTLQRENILANLVSPRYLASLPGDSLAFISDLYAGELRLITIPGLSSKLKVPIRGWTEQMILLGDNLYIAQSSLSLSADGKNEHLLIYSLSNQILIDSIQLGRGLKNMYMLPSRVLALGYSGIIGNTALEPYIILYSTTTHQIVKKINLPIGGLEPSRFSLSSDGRYLAFLSGGIHFIDLNNNYEMINLAFRQRANLTSLAWKPGFGINYMWVADSKGFAGPGMLYNLRINSDNPNLYQVVDSTKVGIIPGEILYF